THDQLYSDAQRRRSRRQESATYSPLDQCFTPDTSATRDFLQRKARLAERRGEAPPPGAETTRQSRVDRLLRSKVERERELLGLREEREREELAMHHTLDKVCMGIC
ncbi:hypothetical protein KIPB_016797, partial [Kipferlia bialata]